MMLKRNRRQVLKGSDESGVVLILLALLLTLLMMVAAITIDGGTAYSSRRSMQNAADAGSMAGAQALYKAQAQGSVTLATAYPPTSCTVGSAGAPPVTDVAGQAYCAAVSAGGGAASPSGGDFCDVIDTTGALVGTGKCYDPGLSPPEANVLLPNAVGVKVLAEKVRTTFFGNFAGQNTQTIRAKAAASVQPIGGSGAPYVVCGNSSNGGYDFLDVPRDPADPAPSGLEPMSELLPKFQKGGTNADYDHKGSTMIFQENQPQSKGESPPYDTGCGNGNQSDGKGTGTATTGGWVNATNGNGSNPNPNFAVPLGSPWVPCGSDVSAASLPASGCDIILPISDTGNGGNGAGAQYHVVDYALFHIRPGPGNMKVVGYLDDAAAVSTTFSNTGTCPPTSSVCVVKLVDFPTGGLLE